MSILSCREQELVAIGAALASNCLPCIEYHIQAARKAGLNDAEISEAIKFADKIKKVPAVKVLEAAASQLAMTAEAPAIAPSVGCTSSAATKSCS